MPSVPELLRGFIRDVDTISVEASDAQEKIVAAITAVVRDISAAGDYPLNPTDCSFKGVTCALRDLAATNPEENQLGACAAGLLFAARALSCRQLPRRGPKGNLAIEKLASAATIHEVLPAAGSHHVHVLDMHARGPVARGGAEG